MSDTRRKKPGFFVWLIMALLVLGLGGFGLQSAFVTTGGSTVATVGDEKITADRFLSELQQDINRASEQLGTPLSLVQAQLQGLDQQSLRRQVTLAALANEARRLNLSVDDGAVREALLTSPAFQITQGVFSEAAYDLVLQQQRMTRAEYESRLRQELTQKIISDIVTGGLGRRDTAARVWMDFVGETRTLTWAEITPDTLPDPLSAVDDSAARAYYDAHPEAFTTPETRRLTYVILTPEILARSIEVPEEDIRALFAERQAFLNTPAQRIADRLIFPSMEEAGAAMARIQNGEASFADIAAERGLSLEEASIGVIRATQLSDAAAEMVFGSEETGVYGPVEDTLGPAIFNINAAIPAQTASYEEVRAGFRDEIALERAQTELVTRLSHIEDLIAGGVALEDIAAETAMELRHYDLNSETEAALGLDAAFGQEARAAAEGEERDLKELPDGGVFALRVDEIIPPRLRPYEEVAEAANAAATQQANLEAARAYAEELKAQAEAGADLAATLAAGGSPANIAENITRTNPPSALPPAIAQALFEMAAGALATFPSANGAYILRLDSITPFEAQSEGGQAALAQVEAQIAAGVASDTYALFAKAITDSTEISINQGLINQIIAQVSQ